MYNAHTKNVLTLYMYIVRVGGVNVELGDEGLTHYVVADSVDPGDIPLTSRR